MTDPTPTLTDEQREGVADALRTVGYLEYNNGKDEPPEWHVYLDDATDAVAPISARMVADAERRALRDFVAWVAINRAFNGSDHRYGQSLYNECLNAALPEWVEQWLRDRADRIGTP